MPRKLNTLLERLLADKTYTTTTGNTEPSISYGFFGNVTFKPWKDFGQTVESAILAIERLGEDEIAVADRRLAAARDEIALKRRKRERINAAEMRNDAEGRTINSTPANMNELGVELQHKKKRKTADSEPVMRGPVTNSQSILTQYTDVMAAIGSLMDNLYPHLVLIMDQRMVAGEFLTRSVDDDSSEGSDVQIDKAKNSEEVNRQTNAVSIQTVDGTPPESIVNDRAGTRTAILRSDHAVHQSMSGLRSTATNQAAQDGTQTVTRTLSEGVTRNRARERSSVLRKERVLQELGEGAETTPSQEVRAREHTEGGTKLLRRCARLANKQYSFAEQPTGSAIIKLRQTADQALFLASKPAASKVPVSLFELKGPKLNYTGLPCDPDGNKKDNHVPLAANTDRTMPTGETSENSASDMSGASGGVTSAGACKGSGDSQNNKETIYVSKASPDDVALKYNELFSKIEHFSKDSGVKNQRTILLPVIQVLCQALLTQSGCAILTNHQTAIAFRVEEGCSNEKAVKAFVTGVIPCDLEPGSVAAMLALAKFSLDKVISSSPDELLEPKKRLLRKLFYAHYKTHPQVDHDRLDPNWTSGHDGRSSASNDDRGSSGTSKSRAVKPLELAPLVMSRTNQGVIWEFIIHVLLLLLSGYRN